METTLTPGNFPYLPHGYLHAATALGGVRPRSRLLVSMSRLATLLSSNW